MTAPDFVYPLHIQCATAGGDTPGGVRLLYTSMVPDKDHPLRETEVLLHTSGEPQGEEEPSPAVHNKRALDGLQRRSDDGWCHAVEAEVTSILHSSRPQGVSSEDPLCPFASALLTALCFHQQHYPDSGPALLLLFTDYNPTARQEEPITVTTECALASAVTLCALARLRVVVYGPSAQHSARLRGLAASTGGCVAEHFHHSALGDLLEMVRKDDQGEEDGGSSWRRQRREWISQHYTVSPAMFPSPAGGSRRVGSNLAWLCPTCMTVTRRGVEEEADRPAECPYCTS
ncbi:hypothetical protein AGDE_10797 [Angomonas deanei]|uniref:Uncharacterized protein n=1 Tax=Angomonas deanei TaxID=59799 RepID=A0A7G2CB06_9TRYP|nr:hypothetical protein AGDE_10797 [Angomonas deanei]CAD2216084.1 hypothetical protein, conserved [Angomonas deanei]|eukprot:EPY27375.1 hypothetical protein AGDE_10797 [Angomonas deanei]